MRSWKNSKDSVEANEVYGLAIDVLQRSLQWVDQGYRCTVQTILLVLLTAAARLSSLHDVCLRLKDAPSDQAVRNALERLLPKEITQLEDRLNGALQPKLPKTFWRKARPVALDLFQINYYGRCHRRNRELCRGKRQAGTDRFHRYASLCVLRRGQRFTLAMTYVWKDDTTAQVVRRLLERAKAAGLRIRYLLLDRGFYNLDVVRLLQSMSCPFILPVVHRGRRPKTKDLTKLKGTRRFLIRRRSGFDRHAMQNRKEQATVRIAISFPAARTRSGRRRRVRKPLVFAFWRLNAPSPAWVRQTYRSRYGIETSYRQMNQARARTSTRNPRMRLLLVALALILRNLWVLVHHRWLSRVRGRSRQLRLALLRFRTMLLLLQRCAEAVLGCIEVASDCKAVPTLHAGPAP